MSYSQRSQAQAVISALDVIAGILWIQNGHPWLAGLWFVFAAYGQAISWYAAVLAYRNNEGRVGLR